MTVATQPLIDMPIEQIAAEIRAAIEADAEIRLDALLSDLSASTAHALEGSAREIVRYRNRLARVARLIADLKDKGLGGQAWGTLREADRQLDRRRTHNVARQQRQRQVERDDLVLDQVRRELATPRRPREIADKLERDPSEISRAIARLVKEGDVMEVAKPQDAPDDGRAHWYVVAQPELAAAA